MQDILFFNYYSMNWLINLIFYLVLAVYTLALRNKSKATLHFGLIFLFTTLTAVAYVISCSIYHPATTIHRYFTICIITAAEIQHLIFLLHIIENRHPRFTNIIYIILWVINILMTGFFIYKSLSADIVYNFEGHYWDYALDELSKIIGLIIFMYILQIYIAGIYKSIITKGKDRFVMIGILITMFIITFSAASANVLSRDGVFGRDIYYLSMNIITIIGYFLIIVLYINTTKDRTSFMAKIIGISLLTFLLIFLSINYFLHQLNENNYDMFHTQLVPKVVSEKKFRPYDLSYLSVYSLEKDTYSLLYSKQKISIDDSNMKTEFLNTALWQKIEDLKNYKDEKFSKNLKAILDTSHTYFAGYRALIHSLYQSLPAKKRDSSKAILTAIQSMDRPLIYNANKIKSLPEINFKINLKKFLIPKKDKFQAFREVLLSAAEESNLSDKELKNEIIQYLVPFKSPQDRKYRIDKNNRHYIAYYQYDNKKDVLYEVGFSYIEYRKFIHKFMLYLTYILLSSVVVIVLGFPIFFLGALVNPLKKLREGLVDATNGNLDVVIPIQVEDEIGFLTEKFNTMVATIKEDKIQINNYTQNLEGMVQERTAELNAAMEEMTVMNDALIKARDALWGEMQLAKKIQTMLLPKQPTIEGFEISAYMMPADDVGGDYYDVINVDNNDWVVIGDVSGHGVPAGLVMMMVQTSIHVILNQNPSRPPSEILTIINKTIAKNIQMLREDKYMTITVFALHDKGRFKFSGLHQDIMIYRSASNDVEIVTSEGMWIGILDSIDGMVKDDCLKLERNDVMLVFTDGITEAIREENISGKKNEMFGTQRLMNILKNHGKESTDAVRDAILNELKKYTIRDDITILLLKCKGYE